MASAEQVANCIRCLAADTVQAPNSGHPGTPLGMAPVSTVLWTEIMKYNSKNPKWFDRDRFVLSNGHGCTLQYALLHLSGFDLSINDLKHFRQLDAKTPGHPEVHVVPGVEVTTGPLGQGIPTAVGLAIAEANLAATYNKPDVEVVNHWTWVFCGDGCLMEGVAQEGLSLAGTLGLEKFVLVYDCNHICIDGSTDMTFNEDHKRKYEALGFHVIEVANGDTDYDALRAAFAEAKSVRGKPKIIVQRTTIGYGSLVAGTSKAHGSPLGKEGVAALKTKLGRDPAKSFDVEDAVYETFRKHVAACQAEEQQWTQRMEQYRSKYPAEAAELEARIRGELPAGWKAKLPLNDKSIATRKCSENVLAALFPALPGLIGGSADLTPSNLTCPASAKLTDFTHSTPQGRYIRFGVREHAMGAIANGIDAHGGFVPFVATFLNFVGYAIGAYRLSALSHHRVLWVATHDSIGLGEDGPTHQPIEIISGLRAMPNSYVFRPCDQTETSGAYAAALEVVHGPSVLSLTRQNTPPQAASSIEAVAKGAYVLTDVANPQVVIAASGSEVGLAQEAAEALKAKGVRARVVSVPCLDLFDEQPDEYRLSLFPPGVPAISVEPYVGPEWARYTHAHVGMTSFGASAPIEDLYKKFDITADRVVRTATKLLELFPDSTAPVMPASYLHKL